MVESAIIVPFMLFVLLCVMQLMLLAHTRVLLDYAAFSAARAGVVHHGSPRVMRNAALLALTPSFPGMEAPGTAHTKHTLERFIRKWGWMKAWATIAEPIDSGTASIENFLTEISKGKVNFAGMFPNVSVVSVDVLNPGPNDFQDQPELDFDLGAQLEGSAETHDDRELLRKTQLTIRVVYLYKLSVPLADRFIWYMYMMTAYVNARLQKTDWVNWWSLHGHNGVDVSAIIDKTKFATGVPLPTFPNGAAAWANDQLMFQALKQIPGLIDWYLMPLVAVHTMPMESNMFRNNLNPGL